MLAAAADTVERALTAAKMTGLALAVVQGDGLVERLIVGQDADGCPLTDVSIFPVASVTKLATALAILRLAEAGILGLDDSLAQHVPNAAASEGISIRRLLSHTAGLPYDYPDRAIPWNLGLDWPTVARAAVRTPLDHVPGTRVQYGNVAYDLLAVVVERGTGQTFADALRRLVLEPLGIEGYLGIEPPRAPVRVADVRGPDVDTPLDPLNSPFFRSLALPAAGLLTTLDGALALGRAYQGRPAGFLRPEMVTEATRNQVGDLAGGLFGPLNWDPCPWGLGPELHGTKLPHWAPRRASQESFGHIGASGCIVWVDPVVDVAWAILGTRTFFNDWPRRQGAAIGGAILRAASVTRRDLNRPGSSVHGQPDF